MRNNSLLIVVFFLFTIAPHHACAKQRVYLEIGATDVQKISFAVPWFEDKSTGRPGGPTGRKIADILAKALKFHGIIEIVPTEKYGGSQNSNWRSLGADFTVLGNFDTNKDVIKLELRLLDVANNKMLLGKSYSGKSDQRDDMLYRFCNSVISDLTGSQGLADTQIAFVSDGKKKRQREVFISDILGRKIRQVTRHRNLVVSPRFLPDSNFLTYTSYHTGNQNLYITDLRQNKTTRVLSRRRGMNLAPGWFPDGQRMTLTLSYQGNPDLYVLNKRGQIEEQLTKNAGINVSGSLSPDGKQMVFVSDRFGGPQLFVMDLATKKTQRLTFEGTENAEPDWHPRENLIVYSSLRNGVYQICVKAPDRQAESTQLTTDLSHHESPTWSPDGNQIIFSKQDGRENKIYAMMKNGSFQRKLFHLKGSQTYPRWANN